MLPTFIRLENTLEKAMLYQDSPQNKYYDFRGVHLMSNPPFDSGYIQRTYSDDGIEIETIELEFYDTCGTLLGSDTDAEFTIIRNFNDPNTGLPQVEWRLQPNGVDFGDRLIYMRIKTGANVYVYSSPFVLSDENYKFTSLWCYRNKNQMMQIGLNAYRRNFKSEKASTNYTTVDGVVVTGTSSITKYERWFTSVIDLNVIELVSEIEQCREIYTLPMYDDGLPKRTRFFEPMESVDPEGDENFGETELSLSRNDNDLFNPDAVPIVPTPPEPLPPTIDLQYVESINTNQVRLTFATSNFSPTYLTAQYSEDGVTWDSSTGSPLSPRTLNAPNNVAEDYYYRLTHELATSQVLQLPKKKITLVSVIRPNPAQPNTYTLSFSVENFTPLQTFRFMYSANGVSFKQAAYTFGNNSPKTIQIPVSGIENPYFRIESQEILLISNVLQYE